MQEVALCILAKHGFFESIALYGGAALSLLHGSPRYSRNLDFCTVRQGARFLFDSLAELLVGEFDAYGLTLKATASSLGTIRGGRRADQGHDRLALDFVVPQTKAFRLTLAVDLQPFPDVCTEELPLPDQQCRFVRCVALPDQFAAKVLSLLGRSSPSDWFDYSWFIRNGVMLDFTRFIRHAEHAGLDHYASLSIAQLRRLLLLQVLSFWPQHRPLRFIRTAAHPGITFEEIRVMVDEMAIA